MDLKLEEMETIKYGQIEAAGLKQTKESWY